jgi:hypothetical protein
MTAYSQLHSILIQQIEYLISNGDKNLLNQYKEKEIYTREESEKMQINLTKEIAKKEQKIIQLENKNTDLSTLNKTLVRKNEILNKEIGKISLSLDTVLQESVEIRLQSLDFKSEIDRRAFRVLKSVHSKLGFFLVFIAVEIFI